MVTKLKISQKQLLIAAVIVILLYLIIQSTPAVDPRQDLIVKLGQPTIVTGSSLTECQQRVTTTTTNGLQCSECLSIPSPSSNQEAFKAVCTPKGKPTITEAKLFLCKDFNSCPPINPDGSVNVAGGASLSTGFGSLINKLTLITGLSAITIGVGLMALAVLLLFVGVPAALTAILGVTPGLIIGVLFILGGLITAGGGIATGSSFITPGQSINQSLPGGMSSGVTNPSLPDLTSQVKSCYDSNKAAYDLSTQEGITALSTKCKDAVCNSQPPSLQTLCRAKAGSLLFDALTNTLKETTAQ